MFVTEGPFPQACSFLRVTTCPLFRTAFEKVRKHVPFAFNRLRTLFAPQMRQSIALSSSCALLAPRRNFKSRCFNEFQHATSLFCAQGSDKHLVFSSLRTL